MVVLRLLFLLALLTLCSIGASCGSDQSQKVNPTQGSNCGQALKVPDAFTKDQDYRWGCLAIIWQSGAGGDPSNQVVKLTREGKILANNGERDAALLSAEYDQIPQYQPPSPDTKPTEARLFIFSEKSQSLNTADAGQLCSTLARTSLDDCGTPGGDCWFGFLLTSSQPGESGFDQCSFRRIEGAPSEPSPAEPGTSTEPTVPQEPPGPDMLPPDNPTQPEFSVVDQRPDLPSTTDLIPDLPQPPVAPYWFLQAFNTKNQFNQYQNGEDRGQAIAVSQNGSSIWITGSYGNDIQFRNNLPNNTNNKIFQKAFVAMTDKRGEDWSQGFAIVTQKPHSEGRSITVTTSHVFVGGWYSGNNQTGTVRCSGDCTGFIMRFATASSTPTIPDLQLQVPNASVEALALSGTSTLIAYGQFTGTSTLGSRTIQSKGNYDLFLAAYDLPSGKWLWAHSLGSSGLDRAWYLKVDSSGNIYISGDYAAVPFVADPISTNSGNAFVAQFNPKGNLSWFKDIDAAGRATRPVALALTGPSLTVAIACKKNTKYGMTLVPSDGICIAKLDTSSGTWLTSHTNIGGVELRQAHLTKLSSGDLFLSVSGRGTNQLGSMGTSSDNVIFALLNANGQVKKDQQRQPISKVYGGKNFDYVTGAVTNGQDVFVTGYFRATYRIGRDSYTSQPPGSSSDLYIWKNPWLP